MKPVLEVNCFEIFLGRILGQKCVWLSDTVLDDLLFLKNLTYEMQCKYAMKIEVLQSREAFFSIFLYLKSTHLCFC